MRGLEGEIRTWKRNSVDITGRGMNSELTEIAKRGIAKGCKASCEEGCCGVKLSKPWRASPLSV
jgi:hypothetical protein